ncbi:hypothetical protein ELQ39_00060 [Streptomyces sp. GB4-14]|uniref:ParB/Srx family N-terminal domain-containing protein n=1 Tax=Streptomyces sp. GB4-14 TaxID=2498703 RepID=UPI001F5D9900|nr:hypothetical protein [Streptomyces sp. GB4-14]
MDKATYARTEDVLLPRLRPYPGNAKIGNVPKILESLCRNGQYRSLVVREHDDGTLTVLAGNHTLQALAAHGPGDCGMTTGSDDSARPCSNGTCTTPRRRGPPAGGSTGESGSPGGC